MREEVAKLIRDLPREDSLTIKYRIGLAGHIFILFLIHLRIPPACCHSIVHRRTG
jgi:hypothetical protein